MLRKTIDGIESIGYSFETQADVRRERLKLRRGNWGLGADEESDLAFAWGEVKDAVTDYAMDAWKHSIFGDAKVQKITVYPDPSQGVLSKIISGQNYVDANGNSVPDSRDYYRVDASGNPVNYNGGTVPFISGVGGAAIKLTKAAQETLAATESGVLLGTIEGGEVSLFKSAAGQIEGHSQLLTEGLVGPGAEGFSVVMQNGQVTVLRTFSTLNSSSANYNLSTSVVQKIVDSLRASGARIITNP